MPHNTLPADDEPKVPREGYWRSYGPALDAIGYELVPLKRGTKRPAGLNWPKTNYNTDRSLRRAHHGDGVGIKTGTVVAFDVDCDDPKVVELFAGWCRHELGPTVRRNGRRGAVLFYRACTPQQKLTSRPYVAAAHQKMQQLEVLGVGQQVAVYAEDGNTGEPYYRYPHGELIDRPVAALIELSRAQISSAADYFERLANAALWTPAAAHRSGRIGHHKPAIQQRAPIWKLRLAMAAVPIDPESYERWIRLGMAIHHATGGSAEGLELWDQWSRTGRKYDGSTFEKWGSFNG